MFFCVTLDKLLRLDKKRKEFLLFCTRLFVTLHQIYLLHNENNYKI